MTSPCSCAVVALRRVWELVSLRARSGESADMGEGVFVIGHLIALTMRASDRTLLLLLH